MNLTSKWLVRDFLSFYVQFYFYRRQTEFTLLLTFNFTIMEISGKGKLLLNRLTTHAHSLPCKIFLHARVLSSCARKCIGERLKSWASESIIVSPSPRTRVCFSRSTWEQTTRISVPFAVRFSCFRPRYVRRETWDESRPGPRGQIFQKFWRTSRRPLQGVQVASWITRKVVAIFQSERRGSGPATVSKNAPLECSVPGGIPKERQR